MYQKERTEQILSLLRQHGYLTVKYLTRELHYSKATVQRDLKLLEQAGQIKRTWGGVEPATPRSVPVLFRYEKAKPTKKRLGKCAAELVEDGDVIFMDGSTTVQYMREYLIEKKDLHVLTNNMALAIFFEEYGIDVTVLGGKIMEPPYMLAGTDTVETASRYRADKCFFSTSDVSSDGEMAYEGDIYFSMHKTMMRNSGEVFYLVDKDKVDKGGGRVLLGDFSLVDTVITDHAFDEAVKARYPRVRFVQVEGEKKEARE